MLVQSLTVLHFSTQYLCLNAILNLSPLSEIDNRFSFVFCFPEPIKTYLSNNSNQSDLKL